jgi:hypothetical protein
MALSVYVLVGYFKLETKSNEGAVKYFVLGALSSGVLLYGISLVYGTTGSLDLETIRRGLTAVPEDNPTLQLGILLVAFGMLFKVAAVPFHVWTPDAYEGAPTPVTAFMSVGPKAAAFAMFLRLFMIAFAPEVEAWQTIVWIASAATMIYGNIAALTQDNVKRMLAYSSIAHAGYALMGLVAASGSGLWAVLMYLAVYAFMNLGAFGFVILLESKGYAGETIADYAGLPPPSLQRRRHADLPALLAGIRQRPGSWQLYIRLRHLGRLRQPGRHRGGHVGGEPLLLLPPRGRDVPSRRERYGQGRRDAPRPVGRGDDRCLPSRHPRHRRLAAAHGGLGTGWAEGARGRLSV